MKIPKEQKKYNYFSEDDLEKAIALREKGFSYRAIGNYLNFGHSVIMYHLCEEQKKNSLERHKRVEEDVLIKARKNYNKRFQKINGVNYSTQYDREHKQIRNLKSKNYYRKKVGLPLEINNLTY